MALAAYSAIYTALATAGLVLLRRSLGSHSLVTVAGHPGFLIGGLCYAASFATFLLALRRFELLTVYPVFTGLAYGTLTVAATIFLNETLTPLRLAGIVLVAGGVALLVR